MKIAISRHAAKLQGAAAASPVGEAPSQGPGPTGTPTFPTPWSGETSVSLSCGFVFFFLQLSHTVAFISALLCDVRSSLDAHHFSPWLHLLYMSFSAPVYAGATQAQRERSGALFGAGRVVARDSGLSISVRHPSLKPATSSCPGELCCTGCVQGEARDGTV